MYVWFMFKNMKKNDLDLSTYNEVNTIFETLLKYTLVPE